jgi:hypothetical protein
MDACIGNILVVYLILIYPSAMAIAEQIMIQGIYLIYLKINSLGPIFQDNSVFEKPFDSFPLLCSGILI